MSRAACECGCAAAELELLDELDEELQWLADREANEEQRAALWDAEFAYEPRGAF